MKSKKIISALISASMIAASLPIVNAFSATVTSELSYYNASMQASTASNAAYTLGSATISGTSSEYAGSKYIVAAYTDSTCQKITGLQMATFASNGTNYTAATSALNTASSKTIKQFFINGTTLKPIAAAKGSDINNTDETWTVNIDWKAGPYASTGADIYNKNIRSMAASDPTTWSKYNVSQHITSSTTSFKMSTVSGTSSWIFNGNCLCYENDNGTLSYVDCENYDTTNRTVTLRVWANNVTPTATPVTTATPAPGASSYKLEGENYSSATGTCGNEFYLVNATGWYGTVGFSNNEALQINSNATTTYNVSNIPAGTYSVKLYGGNAVSGEQASVKVGINGTSYTAAAPEIGGIGNYNYNNVTVANSVTLTASNTITITCSNGYWGAIDYLEFASPQSSTPTPVVTSSPATPTPSQGPVTTIVPKGSVVTLQGENASFSGTNASGAFVIGPSQYEYYADLSEYENGKGCHLQVDSAAEWKNVNFAQDTVGQIRLYAAGYNAGYAVPKIANVYIDDTKYVAVVDKAVDTSSSKLIGPSLEVNVGVVNISAGNHNIKVEANAAATDYNYTKLLVDKIIIGGGTIIASPTPTVGPQVGPQRTANPSGAVTLLSPLNNYDFNTHPEIVDEYLAYPRYAVGDSYAWYGTYYGKGSFPESLTFTWSTSKSTSRLQISEDPTFATCFYDKTISGTSASVTNFKTGTKYYWRVDGCTADAFTTKPGVRLIFIDGLKNQTSLINPTKTVWPNLMANVRDCGGYTTTSGKTIPQGLIYRGMAFETGPHTEPCQLVITDEGKDTIKNVMGIKTDIDLRESDGDYWSGSVTKDLYNELGITRHQYKISTYYYAFLTEATGKAFVKNVFTTMASAELPMYIHCQGGQDRTGIICALLEGMLGVSEEEIMTDYELTTLAGVFTSAISRNEDSMGDGKCPRDAWKYLKSLSGNTYQEKVINYLTNECGVSQSTITTLQNRLLQ